MENSSVNDAVYVTPMVVTSKEDCEFYHVMDVPGEGVCGGKWDLRNEVDAYLGGFDFKGKRVLELGAASGFLCFEMEKKGAEVVSYDIGDDQKWDMVPFAQYDYKSHIKPFREYTDGFKKAYWYAHKAHNSSAKVVYGSIYDVPEEIGVVDVATFGSILLHLRNPFAALETSLRLVKESVVITDMMPSGGVVSTERSFVSWLVKSVRSLVKGEEIAPRKSKRPYMVFLPEFKTLQHKEVWWSLSPEIIVAYLGILGFEETEVTYHGSELNGKDVKLFTVVGKRTKHGDFIGDQFEE